MKVLVGGGAGFTGRRVVRSLVEDGHQVRCLLRETSDPGPLAGLAVEIVAGDLADVKSVVRALEGREAFVNVASIGFGQGPGLVEAAIESRVDRVVFFSTTAIFTRLPARSRAVRLAAEESIRSSGLAYTILRPTMIYGAPGDRNVERLLGAVRRYPALPLVGGGRRRIQPVVVDDLGAAVGAVLAEPRTMRRCYSLSGRAPVSFRELVRCAARAVGRKVRLLSVPGGPCVRAARLYEVLSRSPRVRSEQVERLLEDKAFDSVAAGRDFGFAPMSVEEGLRLEVERGGGR